MLTPNTEVIISWRFLSLTYRTIKGRLLRNVLRTCPLELNIRSYGDILITSAGDVLKTLIGDVPWSYI